MDRGFVSDFDGYCLEYNEPNISDVEITHTRKSCSAAMLDDCIKLFDDAYNPLTVEEDLKPDFYANHTEWFANYLLNLGDGIQTFWKDDTLVGAYILDGIYLRDVVVASFMQGKGFGSEIITRAMQVIRKKISGASIHLRVARANRDARKLY